MKRRLIVSELARLDIAEIVATIRQQNQSAALRFQKNVAAVAELVAEYPDFGSLCGFTAPGAELIRVRTITGFENYLMFFQATGKEVEIARVIHGGRDWRSGIGIR